MSGLTITEDTVRGVAVMAPVGRIDSATAKEFETSALNRISAGAIHMVFDFAELDYISSAGLRVVLLAGKRLRATSGALVLCALQPAIRDVFEISGFLGLFEVRDTREEAVDVAA